MTPPTEADLFTAARTIAGEARGEPLNGQCAVAHVIINRWRHGAASISEVCMKARQFSCWNEGDQNRDYIESLTLANRELRIALYAVIAALEDLTPDATNGSRHYHAIGTTPYWAVGKISVATIGRHAFYDSVA